jgi:predicted MPP superfamily phosphohydrolase
MNLKLTGLLLAVIVLPYLAPAQTSEVHGVIYNDVNNNGVRDNNEPGIRGVAVSDQVNVVTSDNQGRYQLTSLKGNGLIMVSVPDGYRIKDSSWKKIGENNQNSIDFPMIRTDQQGEFSFIHASDTHISEKSLDRMQKLRTAIEKANPDFVLITGDLVRDALRVSEKEATGYYDLFLKEIQKLKTPVWCVPGNHEIFGIERHLSLVSAQHPLYGTKMYRHYLGPDYYSFNYGGVHFVGLNSLKFDDLWYYGGIDSLQLEWLKKDIALLPSEMPVVTFQHVPFYCGGLSISPFEEDGLGRTTEKVNGVKQFRHIVANAQKVLAILKDRNFPLALAGHYHFQQKFTLEGVQTRFEQTAAVIGPSEQGIIKMPSGITIYHVKDGKINEGKFITLDQPVAK